MDSLLQLDRTTIKRHPLEGIFDHLRDSLYRVDLADDADARPEDARNIVSRLIAILQGHEVALNLKSVAGRRNLASDLAAAFQSVQSGNFKYDHYRALARLIIQKARDEDVWSAVVNLLLSLSRTTPPASIPPSFDGTPITYSSASQQGNEQTKRMLNPLILHEIKDCTFRDVDGFLARYFEGRSWSKRVEMIYTSIKSRHVDGHWSDFPDPSTEPAVWEWISSIQKEYFPDARGMYCHTIRPKELTGGEAARQLDLFVKQRKRSAQTLFDKEAVKEKAEVITNVESAGTDWREVWVVGEHQVSSNDWKEKFLQLGKYVRDIFSAQPTRRYIHAFTLLGATMELWVFDRSGPYSSGVFNIHEEPERFIKALAGYAFMSDEELGLDTFVVQEGRDRFVDIIEDTTGMRTRIQLEQDPMFIHRAIVCRGTTCYRSKDEQKVVKVSWPSDLRTPEADYLRLAREKGVKGVATLIGDQSIISVEQMRDGMTFSTPQRFRMASALTSTSFSGSQPLSRSFGAFQSSETSSPTSRKRKPVDYETKGSKRSRSNSQTSKLREQYSRVGADASQGEPAGQKSTQDAAKPLYKNRLLNYLVIAPAGRKIAHFTSISELLTALRDAIKGHWSLLEKAGILHRDISENNIIITDPIAAEGWTGILIDLDLAIMDGERSGARHQTGTMEFMAIDVLRGVEHTYRHDLESFFYVLLWICARRAWDREFHCKTTDRPRRMVLGKWYGTNLEDVADAKEHHMSKIGFEAVLKEFPQAFNLVKPLCSDLRDILFPLTSNGKPDYSTPSEPQTLYRPIIEAFDKAITECLSQAE